VDDCLVRAIPIEGHLLMAPRTGPAPYQLSIEK